MADYFARPVAPSEGATRTPLRGSNSTSSRANLTHFAPFKALAALRNSGDSAAYEAEYRKVQAQYPGTDVEKMIALVAPPSPVSFSPGVGTPIQAAPAAPVPAFTSNITPIPVARDGRSSYTTSRATVSPTSSSRVEAGASSSANTSNMFPVSALDGLLHQLQIPLDSAPDATTSMTTIRYGMKVVLRGCHGRCLRAAECPPSSSPSPAAAAAAADGAAAAAAAMVTFAAEADGTGTGAADEALMLVKAERRDDRGAVAYGDAVALRSRRARERFLAQSSSGDLHFSRVHIGKAEQWVVEAAAGGNMAGGGSASAQQRRVVAAGDSVILRSALSRLVLAVRPRGEGREGGGARLTMVERALAASHLYGRQLGGEEAWVPCYPPFNDERRYLNGTFLLDSGRFDRAGAAAALFGAAANGGFDGARAGLVPLDQHPVSLQEQLLLEDLLSALMGLEGRYIRATGRAGPGALGATGAVEAPKTLQEVEFTVDVGGAEQGFGYLAERMLPLCSCYVRVSRFVLDRSRSEFGLVAHALSAAMRLLLKEYLVLVAQLEGQLRRGALSLQRLWFYLQPTLRTMGDLDKVCQESQGLKGGQLVNRLRDMSRSGGNSGSRHLYLFLLQRACVPYLDMLSQWIYTGALSDPYGEFMIREEEGMLKGDVQEEGMLKGDVQVDFNAQYWEGRYTIQQPMVASFLQAHAHKILTTGKYLNVVRECGKQVLCPHAGPITMEQSDTNDTRYGEIVEAAYAFASRTLLDVVVGECQLMARLRTIKHFFLLDQGDLFVHFMDVAEEELRKESKLNLLVVLELGPGGAAVEVRKEVERSPSSLGYNPQQQQQQQGTPRGERLTAVRLESLLHLGIQMSSVSSDPFKDDLGCEFSQYNLTRQLEAIHSRTPAAGSSRYGEDGFDFAEGAASPTGTGLRGMDSLVLTYRVKWPLSLIISAKALTKYNLLFRHLFFAKHVERMLLGTWRDHQAIKELSLGQLMLGTYRLRQRMLHFMQNFVYYMTFEVIEPRWRELEAALGRAATADDLLTAHVNFLDTCLTECLLSSQDLVRVLVKLMTVCVYFCDQMKKWCRTDKMKKKWCRTDKVDEATINAAAGVTTARAPPSRSSSASTMRDSQHAGAAAAAPVESSVDVRRRRVEVVSGTVRGEVDTRGFADMVAKFERNFDLFLAQFMSRLWSDSVTLQCHAHLSNLCTRLDYNGYFRAKYAEGGGGGRAAPR
ncbi:Spc98 family-domain-containing protein [Tribonema minus]|uniref:Spc98 family-domain-containing protein n=1 Tax=Tribonema minus TaxID=303371 RepID=A0A835ZJD2_9STRA|nr:Spc98 family-domain-containing protein [Tribonema minus]